MMSNKIRQVNTTSQLLLMPFILAVVGMDLCGQVTQLNTDSLKIRSGIVTKILVAGDASASVAFPSAEGVLVLEQVQTPYPTGAIVPVLNQLPIPEGYLLLDGQAISRTEYAGLLNKIGTVYGNGNGSTTFNIPTLIDPYVPRSGLVGWWTMNADGKDRWFQKNNATVNGPAAVSSRFGRDNEAYYFDGVNDELRVTNACFNNGWSEWTVSIWANLDAVQRGTFLNTFPHNAMGIGAVEEGKYQVAIGNGTVWLSNGWYTNGSYLANEWYHFCVVKNGLNVKLYVNGVLDKEYTLPSAPPDLYCSFYIGRCNCAGEFAKGRLDDLGLWSRALTTNEIEELYRSTHCAVIRSK